MKVAQAHYAAKKAANSGTGRDESPGAFTCVSSAAILTKNAKFMKNAMEKAKSCSEDLLHAGEDRPEYRRSQRLMSTVVRNGSSTGEESYVQ